MKSEKFYFRNPEIVYADLSGDTCLFDPLKAEYLNLNETASEIWKLLDKSKSLDEIITCVNFIYKVDFNICRDEIITFLTKAVEFDIIRERPYIK